MRHFDITSWTDFVRGAAPERDHDAMQSHLEGGCRKCAAAVAALRRVASLAAAEMATAPPDHAVRSVKALHALSRPRRPSLFEKVLLTPTLDSAREPAPVAVRGARVERRHLCFESEEFVVDLWLDRADHQAHAALLGQVASQAGQPLAEAPAYLLSGGRVSACRFTNELGGFELEVPVGDNLELWIGTGGSRLIGAALPAPPTTP